jgi:hypothetical protein
MPVPTVNDFNNAAVDLQTIGEFATSPEPTLLDRLGQERNTLEGVRQQAADTVAGEITGVTAARLAAETAKAGAEAARDQASLATATIGGVYPNGAATNIPKGIPQSGVGAITPGAGGTNGTFALAWQAGTGNFEINPSGTFTVAGGVLTNVTMTGPGRYIGAPAAVAPTPSFAASAGLAGAAVVLTPQLLVGAGQGYWVSSADGLRLDRYKNVGGVATSDTANVASIPTSTAVDDTYHERFFSAQSRYLSERRLHNKDVSRRKALVAMYLGQSNGTGGVNAQSLSGSPSANAYMPFAGPYLGYYSFYSANIEYPMNFTDIASAVPYVEAAASEGPCGGLVAALDGIFPRIYCASAAIGGQSLLKLMGSGLRCNLYAMLHKLCDYARAAGYEPVVVGATVHGEANMGGFGDMTEDAYYTYAPEYYRDFQKAAAQAMNRPEWRAPIVFHNPAQNGTAACWKIHRAIVRAAAEVENAILSSPINQWQVNGDGVHNSALGYRERGEWDGYLLRRFLQDGVRKASPKLVQAVRNGVNVTMTFDQEVTLRTQGGAFNLGSGLNVGVAQNGVEFVDNGAMIAINAGSMVFNGRIVTFSLASAPVGAAGTQEVRIGMQAGTQSGWPNNISGSPIAAANDAGEPSIYDPTKRSYHYVAPFSVTVR